MLKAVPVKSSSEFEGWGAGDCEAEPEGKCQVSASEAQSVTAKFTAIPQNTLAFEKKGPGYGTVSSSPAGISCGPTCTSTSASYQKTKTVLLKAVPKTGEEFGGWTGCDSEPEGKCSVTMSAAKEVEAEFK